MKKIIYKILAYGAGLALFALACILNACNVTRVITNESKYTTRGDTAVMIQTKTIETYDARKQFTY